MIHLKTPYQLGGIIKLTILKANTIAISLFYFDILYTLCLYSCETFNGSMDAFIHQLHKITLEFCRIKAIKVGIYLLMLLIVLSLGIDIVNKLLR